MPGTLTAAELASIRDAILDLLPDTGYIITVTNANVDGEIVESYGTSSGIACRIDPKTYSEQTTAGAVQPFHSFVLTLPNTATITTEHRFLVNSEMFNVISVDADKSWKASTRVFLERI